MYSRYNPVPNERFYPVTDTQEREPDFELEPVHNSASEEAEEVHGGMPAREPGLLKPGLINGILDAFKHEGGKLDYGSLIILLITIMILLEDGNSETHLLIIAAALIIVGF